MTSLRSFDQISLYFSLHPTLLGRTLPYIAADGFQINERSIDLLVCNTGKCDKVTMAMNTDISTL